MKNGGKLQTENNVHNEAYDDDKFDVQSKRQAREFDLSLFYSDRLSTFSKNIFGIDITVIHAGT